MKERRIKTRTHYIHRLKYSTQERIASAFVLIAIGALVWLLFNHSKSLIVFEDYITLYGQLETVQPINKDTEVIVGGLAAGSIEDVSITENNRVVVTIKVLERYRKLLRTDSVARLNTFNLALIDKSIIEISVGSPDRKLLEDGASIDIIESVNIRELVSDLKPAVDAVIRTINRVDEILAAIEPARVAETVDNIESLSAAVEPERIRRIMTDLSAVSGELRSISARVNAGEGVAGTLLVDEKMEREIRQVSENMARISVSMDRLINMLNRELARLPQVLDKIEPLMQEADETIKATQRIWPLSNAIGDEPDVQKLTPQAPAND